MAHKSKTVRDTSIAFQICPIFTSLQSSLFVYERLNAILLSSFYILSIVNRNDMSLHATPLVCCRDDNSYGLRVRPFKPPKQKKDTAAYKKAYYTARRQALKDDQQSFLDFKATDAKRSRTYRTSLSPSKKKHQGEAAKLRMRAMRQRRRQDPTQGPARKVTTRHERELLREMWRAAKRKQRLKMTSQAKRSLYTISICPHRPEYVTKQTGN
jgi:hypothetical protein